MLYQHQNYETDDGRLSEMPIERLVRENSQFAQMGSGMECPRCHRHMALFFGDPDADHWCIACQILSDAGLDHEGNPILQVAGTTDSPAEARADLFPPD